MADQAAQEYREHTNPDPPPPWTLFSTVLPPPLICGLFLIIAIFATWEFILKIAVAMAGCFGSVGVGLVFEW